MILLYTEKIIPCESDARNNRFFTIYSFHHPPRVISRANAFEVTFFWSQMGWEDAAQLMQPGSVGTIAGRIETRRTFSFPPTQDLQCGWYYQAQSDDPAALLKSPRFAGIAQVFLLPKES